MQTADLSRVMKALGKNKYVLLVLALGLLLLLLPRTATEDGTAEGAAVAFSTGEGNDLDTSGIPLDTESVRLAALLSQIEGVGEATVLLSAAGAVVVCAGAESPSVRLNVTNAVSAYTGLGSDKITVMKLQNETGGNQK
ncbi:MAG: hypothetical protein LUG15_04520 [Oscillospiraceae bacterium]|nr:hypothetical protein [Oscillospiraceae bacterium]MCD7853229.1 hypothetical protein [Oscillospiraceae bacterium]